MYGRKEAGTALRSSNTIGAAVVIPGVRGILSLAIVHICSKDESGLEWRAQKRDQEVGA